MVGVIYRGRYGNDEKTGFSQQIDGSGKGDVTAVKCLARELAARVLATAHFLQPLLVDVKANDREMARKGEG